jgi:DNA-binding Xre family transcriptional regulator
MGITYKGLRETMIEKGIKMQDLHNIGISNGTVAKINKNEYIRLDILEKIAVYLGKDIGDIVQIKKEA